MNKVSNKQKGATRRGVVKKHRFRFRIKHLLALISFGGAAFLIQPLVGELTEFFDRPLQGVKVTGRFTHIDAEQIASLVEQQIAEGILMTDLQNIQATLLAQPWVKQASVRRQWPGHLEVWLAEHEPVAKFNDALLSSEIHVFRSGRDSHSLQLPQLTGSLGSESVIWMQYQRLQQLLQNNELEVTLLNREDRGAWNLTLKAGSEVQLYLGSEDLDEKIERFLALYRDQLRGRMDEIERIDMRYTHGVAVRWKQAETREENT